MDKQEKTVKSNLVFEGKVVSLYVDDVKCPNGNLSKREIVRHHGGVCVLAIVDNKVIIEKQYMKWPGKAVSPPVPSLNVKF